MNRFPSAVCCALAAVCLLLPPPAAALSVAPVVSCVGSRDTGIPCRVGLLVDTTCPGLSHCDSGVPGGFATCCCDNLAAFCPNCTLPVNCLADPCQVTSCLAFPGATCRSDYCGGCNARYFVGRTEVTDRCDAIKPCSSQGGTDLGVFCGGLSSGKCPGEAYCDIHPADQFATCCCSNPAATCPNCTLPVQCKADPCRVNSCPAFPEATCRADYCGGCNARYFVKGREVTDRCEDVRPCQRRGGVDSGVSCGLRAPQSCPASAYCDVHPADRFATCCCNDPAAICPNCTKPFNCLVDPCKVNSCPAFPGATCRSDYCEGCNAHYFVGRTEVTDRCDSIQPCSRQGGTDLGVSCGRGSSGECPGKAYCDIHPADQFATCCCNDPTATCPGCTRPRTCGSAPCRNARCPGFIFTRCEADSCNGCQPRFFFFSWDVTRYCFRKG